MPLLIRQKSTSQNPSEQGLPRQALPRKEMPCIRCGDCADVCPEHLQPQTLLALLRAQDMAASRAAGLLDCSHCGACDAVCPSAIALVQPFQIGQQVLREQDRQRAVADAARARFLARNQRLERDRQALAARKASQQSQLSGTDAVAAALERARAKRKRPAGDPPA